MRVCTFRIGSERWIPGEVERQAGTVIYKVKDLIRTKCTNPLSPGGILHSPDFQSVDLLSDHTNVSVNTLERLDRR